MERPICRARIRRVAAQLESGTAPGLCRAVWVVYGTHGSHLLRRCEDLLGERFWPEGPHPWSPTLGKPIHVADDGLMKRDPIALLNRLMLLAMIWDEQSPKPRKGRKR